MENTFLSKKKIILFILLFIVFLLIQSTWLWQLMYPIKYDEIVDKYSRQFEVDPFLVLAIIQVETRFKENKISKKGAIGLMQIMPETAEWIVEQGKFSPYTLQYLSQPETNIAFGSWYVSMVYHQFDGNVAATIAAYNAGPGNVSKWIKQGIWDGTIGDINNIPFGETRHYIQRVLYYIDRYQWIYESRFT